MKGAVAMFDRNDFERIMVVELGREAIATNKEMTGLIRTVLESDQVRSILDDHDGSDFERERATFKRYPEMLAVRVEDALGYAGYFLFERLTPAAFSSWRNTVRQCVKRAAEKAAFRAAA